MLNNTPHDANADKLKKAMDAALKKVMLYTPDDLDDMAEVGSTVLIEPYDINGDIPDLPGGWKCKYIGPTLKAYAGRLVLTPEHEHTRRLWKLGQLRKAYDAGLTATQAEIWINCKVGAKHTLLPELARIITRNDKTTINGYLSYSESLNRDSYSKWDARCGDIPDKTPWVVVAIQELLQAMLHTLDGDYEVPTPTVPETGYVDTPRIWERTEQILM